MQQHRIIINGDSPLITNDVITGMDDTSEANIEKNVLNRKKESNKTESEKARIRELECLTSIWTTLRGEVGIPERALRSMIEASAKTLRQGPQVRQGLRVIRSDFTYDTERYGTTKAEIAKTAQFTMPMSPRGKGGGGKINKTRAMFDLPWSCSFVVDTDKELVDAGQLEIWLDIGGRRIGLGDWRPDKSGVYGMFTAESIDPIAE